MADENPFLKYKAPPPEAGGENPFLKYKQPKAAGAEADAALADARKATKGDTLGNELYQSATLGFGKDIDSLGARGVTALENSARKAVGKKVPYSSADAAKAVKQAEGEEQERFHKDHPGGALAADLIGSIATPGVGLLGKGLDAAKIASPALRAMLTGGALGGADAAGNSDGSPLDRLKAVPGGVGVGAATGGVLHGVTHPAGFIKRGGAGISETIDRLAESFGSKDDKGTTDRQQKHGEEVGLKYVQDLVKRLDPTFEKLKNSAAETAGKGVTAAEALGREAVTQLKVAGRRSGKTPDALEGKLRSRADEARSRIVKDFSDIAGVDPEAVLGDMQTHAKKLRVKAAPLYKAWHAMTDIDSDALKDIRKTPAFKEAMGHAKDFIKNEYGNPFEEGLDDLLPLEQAPGKPVMSYPKGGGPPTPTMVPREQALSHAKALGFEHSKAGDEPTKLPTAKAYDYVKRGLDQVLDQFRDKTTKRLDLSSPKAQSILGVRKDLGKALTDSRKPWGVKARAAFDAGGDPIRMEDAFHSAKEMLSNNLKGSDFAQRIDKLSESEIKALQGGVVKHISDMAAAGRARLKDLLTDSTTLKLQRLFGPEKAAKLHSHLQMESDLAKTGARMAPGVGSDTSETLMADKEQTADKHALERVVRRAGVGDWMGALATGVGHAASGAYEGAKIPIDRASRDVVGKLLQMDPSELASHLETIAAKPPPKPGVAEKLATGAGRAIGSTQVTGGLAGQAGTTAAKRTGVSASIGDGPVYDLVKQPDGSMRLAERQAEQ